MRVFGVDIGGSGIKGAPVEIDDGTLAAPRVRLATPSPAEPSVTTATVLRLIVSRRASAGFSAIARQTRATSGV